MGRTAYDPTNDPVFPGKTFKPTADDPLCECGWPLHHHNALTPKREIAEARPGVGHSDCEGFKAAPLAN